MQKEPYRVALAFELCTESDGMVLFSRPQDFRVKVAHWQYWTGKVEVLAPNGQPVAYEIHAYARKWIGKGDDHKQLEHDQHPTAAEIERLVMDAAASMRGFPIRGDGRSEPVAWADPLDEDDFLDESDDPKDFDFVADSSDDFEDEFEDALIGTPREPEVIGREPAIDERKFMEITARVMSDKTPLPVVISIMQSWLLVSGLQLATRHPSLSPYMKDHLTEIARQFQDAIVAVHPEAKEPLEMGWNAENDR